MSVISSSDPNSTRSMTGSIWTVPLPLMTGDGCREK